jgi:hypothetical protein
VQVVRMPRCPVTCRISPRSGAGRSPIGHQRLLVRTTFLPAKVILSSWLSPLTTPVRARESRYASPICPASRPFARHGSRQLVQAVSPGAGGAVAAAFRGLHSGNLQRHRTPDRRIVDAQRRSPRPRRPPSSRLLPRQHRQRDCWHQPSSAPSQPPPPSLFLILVWAPWDY